MKCERVVDRDPQGELHTGCPNEADVERLVNINNVPYLMLLCTFHDAELDREAAAARNRRNERNRRVVADRESRRTERG
jgi:hypothetical protein